MIKVNSFFLFTTCVWCQNRYYVSEAAAMFRNTHTLRVGKYWVTVHAHCKTKYITCHPLISRLWFSSLTCISLQFKDNSFTPTFLPSIHPLKTLWSSVIILIMNKIAILIGNIITKDWIASLTNLAMDKS